MLNKENVLLVGLVERLGMQVAALGSEAGSGMLDTQVTYSPPAIVKYWIVEWLQSPAQEAWLPTMHA